MTHCVPCSRFISPNYYVVGDFTLLNCRTRWGNKPNEVRSTGLSNIQSIGLFPGSLARHGTARKSSHLNGQRHCTVTVINANWDKASSVLSSCLMITDRGRQSRSLALSVRLRPEVLNEHRVSKNSKMFDSSLILYSFFTSLLNFFLETFCFSGA